MAKIDFKAMKNAQKAVEDKVEDNIPEGLEKSYTDLWSGGKETVIQVDISRLVPYSDENGNEQYSVSFGPVERTVRHGGSPAGPTVQGALLSAGP